MPRRPPTLHVVVTIVGCFATLAAARDLTFEDRGAAQRAIEEVYWRHRIWPKDNPGPKPPLEAVVPEAVIRAKVEDYLEKSNALETCWQRPITVQQLQAEIDRMTANTKQPELLQDLFDALDSDPFLIAETLARGTLVDRLAREAHAAKKCKTKIKHGRLKIKAHGVHLVVTATDATGNAASCILSLCRRPQDVVPPANEDPGAVHPPSRRGSLDQRD